MLQLGTFSPLNVITKTDKGIVVDGQNFGELFIPNSQVGTPADIGEPIDVFIYQNGQGDYLATTKRPIAIVGEFASMQVKQVNKLGAFMDWGLNKDILCPFSQQKKRMEENKRYIVRVYLDARTQRMVASSRIDKFLDIWPAEYKIGQEVKLLIVGKTDLGYKAIVENAHWGLLYHNEVYQELMPGQQIIGYIKKQREDGLVDVHLSKKVGKAKVNDFADSMLNYLEDNGGICTLNDKSTPEEIKQVFQVSKKTFKSTIGRLLKLGKIEFTECGFKLK